MKTFDIPKKSSLLRAAPRLMQIFRVLIRHKFLRALLGKSYWPSPKEVRKTLEELGLTFLKFGQVLALRRDLLPHLPAMGIATVRTAIEGSAARPWGNNCDGYFGNDFPGSDGRKALSESTRPRPPRCSS